MTKTRNSLIKFYPEAENPHYQRVLTKMRSLMRAAARAETYEEMEEYHEDIAKLEKELEAI